MMAVIQQMDQEEPEEVSEWRKLKHSLAVNKPLVPLKFTMLLIYGASSLYLPYLTLHMVQIGLNIQEIACIYAVLPFVTFITPPLAGLLADKFNSYKLFLIGLVICSAFFHTMLVLVDARTSGMHPLERSEDVSAKEMGAELFCGRTGSTLVFNNLSCAPEVAQRGNWSLSLVPSHCLMDCPSSASPMRLCFTLDDCSHIVTSSTSDLEMDFQMFVDNEVNCTAWVMDAHIHQVSRPATLLCSCTVWCPVTVKMLIPNVDASTMLLDVINGTQYYDQEQQRHNQGFALYFLLRIAASSSLAAAFSMLDATAICMVKNCQGDLGKQRLFGVIGQAVFAMIGGLLLDWTIQVKGDPDYLILFYLADGLFFVVIFLIGRLDVDVERSEGNLFKGLRQMIRFVDVDVFLVMMLLLGACWGFLESFLFVFLIELKATSYLLGMTITLGCVVGIPFLYISDTIVRRIGPVNIIVVSFLLYGLRFFGYSFIRDSWMCLPFEALEAVTVHMMAVASCAYCMAAAPPSSGMLATLNGVVSSLHYSFGRGVGSFIGGLLMVTYGTRIAFQVFGSASLILGVFYFFLHRYHLARIETRRLLKKIGPAVMVVTPSGVDLDVEAEEPPEDTTDQFLIPPDNLMGRRLSCF